MSDKIRKNRTKDEVEKLKDYAKLLFINQKLTQKEIASRVGVTEATVSKWVNENKWEDLRKTILVTMEERMRSAINQLTELDNNIASREEKQRYPSKEESMIKNRLTSDIAALKSETNLTDVINVSMKVTEYFRSVDPERAKDIVVLFDAYIKDHLR